MTRCKKIRTIIMYILLGMASACTESQIIVRWLKNSGFIKYIFVAIIAIILILFLQDIYYKKNKCTNEGKDFKELNNVFFLSGLITSVILFISRMIEGIYIGIWFTLFILSIIFCYSIKKE